MIPRILRRLLLCLLALAWAAMLLGLGGARARVRVAVVGESGEPVAGATAGLSLDSPIPRADGPGVRGAEVSALTDEHGMATLSGQSGSSSLAAWAKMPGCYDTVAPRTSFRALGWSWWTPWNPRRWLPWNATQTLLLKKIGRPIPMYAEWAGFSAPLTIPRMGRQYGFDLEKGDWVAPLGAGATPDLLLRMDGTFAGAAEPFDVSLTVSFPGAGDGLLPVLAPRDSGSRLRLPRLAPAGGYAPQLVKRAFHQGGADPYETGSRDDQNYLLRVRTTLGAGGEVVAARYGKISGDIEFWGDRKLRFLYYLNPTINDRNLEYDPARDLIPQLAYQPPGP